MDLKKKMKAFFTLKRRANDGFTLVELIVVIAILAILGGVAVPAYSGYVTKANKQADITLASEVAHALTLQYYADPLNAPAVASVVLSTNGASAEGFAAKAMAATFGESWTGNALKYDKWGNGAVVTKNVVDHFSKAEGSLAGIYNGTQKPSFAADVEDLYAEVEDTAILWGGVANYGTGANLMKDVASTTLGYTSADPNVSNEDAFAAAWAAGGAWSDVNFSEDGQTKANAGANYAVIKARNTAVGTYLKNTYGYSDEVVDAFMNVAGSDGLPIDINDVLNPSNLDAFPEQKAEAEKAQGVLLSALDGKVDPTNFVTQCNSYFTGGQANIDGLAYYAMMDTIAAAGSNATDDETYWDDMSGAIGIYASIASGEANLTELSNHFGSMTVSEGVAVTLIVKNGAPTIQTSPNALMAGE